MERGWRALAQTGARTEEEEQRQGPFPSATSLFSPDVSSKMASDLLIRLSEATQKARVEPGGGVDQDPGRQESGGGQQDEPGLALSPDGPGASPEPPSLSHTPESNSTTEILASDLLRKLAERQEVQSELVRVKEEEEPMEVDSLSAFDLSRNRPTTNPDIFHFTTQRDETNAQPTTDLRLFDLKNLCGAKRERTFGMTVKQEEEEGGGGGGVSGAGMDALLTSRVSDLHLLGAKRRFGADLSRRGASGVAVKAEEMLFIGAKMEEQSGADQCLRAALWQDMSVNLASTLLHQLSERVSKSNTQMVETTPTPLRNSPALVLKVEQSCSTPSLSNSQPLPESSLRRDQTTGGAYFYRCHVCGFETEGRSLFHGHMTEHRQWERGLFSLHCCTCDASTDQEPEMTAHVDTHLHRHAHVRCPPAPPAVAMETPPETSAHRCRICQRSFPGQQELLVHFQGHRQGNQYRCDRCGHLTRTANKLVEHVRVHTGERPFTCALCPYSAKRRDSLRLHCKVKHPAHAHAIAAHVHANGLVHAPGRTDPPHVHAQRLHAALAPPPRGPLPPLWERPLWRELSPLLPITVLLAIAPRPPERPGQSEPPDPALPRPPERPSQSEPPGQSEPHPSDLSDQSEASCPSASSCKQSYMRYLGLSSL